MPRRRPRFATLAFLLALGASAFDAEASPVAKPWEACVRLKVLDDRPRDGSFSDGSFSVGSGTVIAGAPGRSIVLTCAHIFAASSPSSRIQVDVFDGILADNQVHFAGSFEGTRIAADRIHDVGLVAFAPGRELPACPPVPLGWLPHRGERLIAVGCGGGEDAIVWATSAIRPSKDASGYSGIECTDAPRGGRSGGGLHRADGRIAGVCDFRTGANTGIYAAPESIHRILDGNGLSSLYRETAAVAPAPAPPAAVPAPTPAPKAAPKHRARRPHAVPDVRADVEAEPPAIAPSKPAEAPAEVPATATPPTPVAPAGPGSIALVAVGAGACSLLLLVVLALYLLRRRRARATDVAPVAAPSGPGRLDQAAIVRGVTHLLREYELAEQARRDREKREAEQAAQAARDAAAFEKVRAILAEPAPTAAPAAAEPAPKD